jgi:hypothetical protein
MKTRHILVFLLLLAAGCAKEPQQENSNDNVAGHIPMVFRAETQEISKVLLSDRVTLNWQVDDKIKIFDGTSDNLAPFVSADSGPAVDFYGKVSDEEGPFYALYPYQNDARMEDGTIALTCRIIDVNPDNLNKEASWNTTVSICNNTLYNVPTPVGYLKFYQVKSLKMNKNICAVSETYDQYSGRMCCLYDGSQNGEVIDITDNVYFGLKNSKWEVCPNASAWRPVNNDLPKSAVNPFEKIDFDTGTFTPLPQYATYGAQR